ncbi:FAS1-like dehydratase domain-containing protein [Ruegeria arenilitoris]|uniref:FAS1-like dehydratase domain-containing protein n=1 Tax=Ruegeria arenilitoris TaxID=1173585 RepID=UPI001481A869|nr:MaoC family dehydratase N-terminal domain-containing protein [Ruegeria arenilitoris]
MEVDIHHLQSWVGHEDTSCETLSPSLAAQFDATFNIPSDTAPKDRAPLLIHWCLNQPIAPMSELGRDGHPALGGFLPPVPLPRRMWAGGAIEFHDCIHIGDKVERHSVVLDVQLKHGRTGALCFVTVNHEFSIAGRVVLSERQDIVYRDLPKEGRTKALPEPAKIGTHSKVITPHPTLLFRYSAVTFNGHRIHYDKPFCINTEGYPGLVVHGPMQATMLCQYAANLKGTPPKSFRFRSHSPLFDDTDFTLNAEATGDGMKLWTAAVGGPIAMEAVAVW